MSDEKIKPIKTQSSENQAKIEQFWKNDILKFEEGLQKRPNDRELKRKIKADIEEILKQDKNVGENLTTYLLKDRTEENIFSILIEEELMEKENLMGKAASHLDEKNYKKLQEKYQSDHLAIAYIRNKNKRGEDINFEDFRELAEKSYRLQLALVAYYPSLITLEVLKSYVDSLFKKVEPQNANKAMTDADYLIYRYLYELKEEGEFFNDTVLKLYQESDLAREVIIRNPIFIKALPREMIMAAKNYFTSAFGNNRMMYILNYKEIYEKLSSQDIVDLMNLSEFQYQANKEMLEKEAKKQPQNILVDEEEMADQRIFALKTGKDFPFEVIKKWILLTKDEAKSKILIQTFAEHYPDKKAWIDLFYKQREEKQVTKNEGKSHNPEEKHRASVSSPRKTSSGNFLGSQEKQWWDHFESQNLAFQGVILDAIFGDKGAKKDFVKRLAEDTGEPPALIKLFRLYPDRLTRGFVEEYGNELRTLHFAYIQELRRLIRNNERIETLPDSKEKYIPRGVFSDGIGAASSFKNGFIFASKNLPLLQPKPNDLYYGLNEKKKIFQRKMDHFCEADGVRMSEKNCVELVFSFQFQQKRSILVFYERAYEQFSLEEFLKQNKDPKSELYEVAQKVTEIMKSGIDFSKIDMTQPNVGKVIVEIFNQKEALKNKKKETESTSEVVPQPTSPP